METWEQILIKSIFDTDTLSSFLSLDDLGLNEITEKYPMLINPYYLELIRESGSPIYRQAVPDKREITETEGLIDTLNEESLSPVPGLTQVYDRSPSRRWKNPGHTGVY